MNEKLLKDIIKEQSESKFRQKIILSALKNLLEQKNINGVNNHLIKLIKKVL
jgi:hypothetical protein